MTDKYNNKYRISSARLQSWDYGWNATYFITICTNDRIHSFGKISDNKMQLSPIGIIANILCFETKNHFKNIELDVFIVMPNHIHGILILNNDNVETRHALSLQSQQKSIGQKRFQNQGKNTVSSIIGSYKSAVTKHTNRLNYQFKWQSRFHDHIIRDEKSFIKISEYIFNNPLNWNYDKFNQEQI
jgi:putative transposase